MSLKTIGRYFLNRTNESKNSNAIGWTEDENVVFYSYFEYRNIVECLALGLIEKGMTHKDKVAILANTSKEWHFLDLSIMCSGATTVPIYPTYLSDDIEYILEHSETSILIIENDNQFKKISNILDKFPNIKLIISLYDLIEDNKKKIRNNIPYLSFKDLVDLGSTQVKNNPDMFEANIKQVPSSQLATIIYTSGTTGEPKGAALTQEALSTMLSNVKSFVKDAFSENDRTLVFLPLSHVFGRCDSLMPLIFGWEMVFAESIDRLIDEIGIVKPTVVMSVPRIFEKIYNKVTNDIDSGPKSKKRLFDWAMSASEKYYNKIEQDKTPTSNEIIQSSLAYKLVFSKIYEKFGGRVRFFVSGGAPLSIEIIKFLRNSHLTILEGYGLTETIGPSVLNPLNKQVPGTVGKPIGDVQIRFAGDNEILIKSGAQFFEYYKNPTETEKSIRDGWFHTGDIGQFTSDGYLKITDRKKDIIITSGGKNVAPQKIENSLKLMPHISFAAIIGDRRKFLTALIAIEKEAFHNELAEWNLPKDIDIATLVTHPRLREIIQSELDAVNSNLASYETIKAFHVLDIEVSIENYLTPSLKLKKKLLEDEYIDEINAMYPKE